MSKHHPSSPPDRPGEIEPRDLPKRVIVRDLVILQLKLWLDGIKDIILSPLAIGAAALDVLRGPTADGHRLYKVLDLGERFDLWLNLYDAGGRAEASGEGLFGASRAGENTLLGRLEKAVKGVEEEAETRD